MLCGCGRGSRSGRTNRVAGICGCKHALKNRGVDDLVKKQSLEESICELRMCHEQSSRLVWMRNHESLELCQDFY